MSSNKACSATDARRGLQLMWVRSGCRRGLPGPALARPLPSVSARFFEELEHLLPRVGTCFGIQTKRSSLSTQLSFKTLDPHRNVARCSWSVR
jgi:hypothetical protein